MTGALSTDGVVVDVGGTQLFVAESGHGRAVVALHGGLGLDHTYLRPWLDDLGEGIRTIYLDHRGNGRSPAGRPLTEVDMATWADDVDTVCNALGLDDVVLLGHSYGGFVALECALRHPDRIAGLVLCGTGTGYEAEAVAVGLDRRNATEEQRRAFSGAPFTTDEEFAAWMRVAAPLYLHPAATVSLDVSAVRFRVDALARGADVLAGWDRSADLAGLRVPALIVTGRHDFVMPVEAAAARLAAILPDATCVVFEDSGHLPFIEEPDRFAHVVRSWLHSLPDHRVQGGDHA